MARKYKQGRFTPRNPQKYAGDVTNIIFRSSWEMRFLEWCDTNPAVIAYQSEETVIPYLCETDGRMHRYFLDFKIKIQQSDGRVEILMIEIKPYAQTKPPKFPGRQTARYLKEVETFIKNQSKWKAAEAHAKRGGMKFFVLTENELFSNKSKK